MARAQQAGLIDFSFHNPRDRATDKHHSVDDSPYGGGPGMVMLLEPLVATLRSLGTNGVLPRMVALSPAGRPFTQSLARELAQEPNLVLVCGRYEGFDARLFDVLPIEPISLGDAVLNGGEVAALAIIEATARLVPGFMGKEASGTEESFSAGLLEYPHFTRPECFEGHSVPATLLSGDHARVAAWRHDEALRTTMRLRPDLLDSATLSHNDRLFLQAQGRVRAGKNLHIGLIHHPVLLKEKLVGTTSLTNLDIHDIARISRTYGLGSVRVVTPLEDQLQLLNTLVGHWTRGPGAVTNPDRAEALSLVKPATSFEQALEELTLFYGNPPLVVGTSARPVLDKKGREACPALPFGRLRELLHEQAVLLLLGTGHGLAPELLTRCDHLLPPLRWMDDYNHLPVRAAAALLLDRVLGDRG